LRGDDAGDVRPFLLEKFLFERDGVGHSVGRDAVIADRDLVSAELGHHQRAESDGGNDLAQHAMLRLHVFLPFILGSIAHSLAGRHSKWAAVRRRPIAMGNRPRSSGANAFPFDLSRGIFAHARYHGGRRHHASQSHLFVFTKQIDAVAKRG
jgi:hypothetical protein